MEYLRDLRDKFEYGVKPQSWEETRRLILSRRVEGIDYQTAPRAFRIGNGLLSAFDEMFPIRAGRLDRSIQNETIQKLAQGLEVSRAIVADSTDSKLLVQTYDEGETGYTSTGAYLKRARKAGEIGSIHTHAKNRMPSSPDVVGMLLGRDVVDFIVTPIRVICLFRTAETPKFPIRNMAEGYLAAMGKRKGKTHTEMEDFLSFMNTSPYFSKKNDTPNIWTLDYQDLDELHILGYEAKRKRDVFVLKSIPY